LRCVLIRFSLSILSLICNLLLPRPSDSSFSQRPCPFLTLHSPSPPPFPSFYRLPGRPPRAPRPPLNGRALQISNAYHDPTVETNNRADGVAAGPQKATASSKTSKASAWANGGANGGATPSMKMAQPGTQGLGNAPGLGNVSAPQRERAAWEATALATTSSDEATEVSVRPAKGSARWGATEEGKSGHSGGHGGGHGGGHDPIGLSSGEAPSAAAESASPHRPKAESGSGNGADHERGSGRGRGGGGRSGEGEDGDAVATGFGDGFAASSRSSLAFKGSVDEVASALSLTPA
jgi:hypothetical protein